MAFTFPAASTPGFGASSAPAFGASSSAFSAFGSAPATTPGATGGAFSFASSTPGFGATSGAGSLFGGASGASSSPSIFGANSSPAPGFGAAGASAPSLFGASPAPTAFGAAGTPSMFGATTVPASTPSLFGANTAGATSSFAFGTAAAYPSSWAGSAPGLQVGAPQQPVITYTTKYEDLPVNVQSELQSIQREISTYRDECDRLDRDQRLHDSAALRKNLEEETQTLKRSLEALANGIKADDEALSDFRAKVMRLLRCTEAAVRTFQRAKLWREAPQQYKGQLVPPQVQELLAAPVVLPSPFLELAIQGFMEALDTYRQVVCELEAAVPQDTLGMGSIGGDAPLSTTLPTIVSHLHDFFVHVAAQLEQLHNQVERTKSAFLSARQANGDPTNPFADARRHQHLAAARPVVLPPAGGQHGGHSMAHGHGAGHQLHAGTAHGPGGSPMPGAFGTPLAGPPYGQVVNGAGAGDASKKPSKAGRRK